MTDFFRQPFALSGTRTTVPQTDPGNGSMNFTDGYGPDYQLPLATDPAALTLSRGQFNQLMYQSTSAIRTLQIYGVPEFITSADNGGSPFSYSKNATVRWTDGEVYKSLINSNTTDPSNLTNWVQTSGPIALSRLAAQAANTVLANATAASDVPTAVAMATNTILARAGSNITALAMGAQSVLIRAAGDITAQAVSASKLVGRGNTGDLGEITLGTGLSFSGTTLNATATTVPYTAPTTTVGASFDFLEGTNNGTNKVTLKSPDTLAGDFTVVLPSTSGILQNGTDWALYAATLTGFGTVSVQSVWWKQIGDSVAISGIFTSGTSTASEARVSLPGSFTVNGTKVPALRQAGTGAASSTGAFFMATLMEPSVAYITFGLQASGRSALSKAAGNVVALSGDQVSINALVPVA